jgi:hypothetical protein
MPTTVDHRTIANTLSHTARTLPNADTTAAAAHLAINITAAGAYNHPTQCTTGGSASIAPSRILPGPKGAKAIQRQDESGALD